MSFTSYAQNFEDVLLYRALGDVSDGFYIDVGAYDPVVDSVTKAFYDLGWTGINIEPVAAYADKFDLRRPRDINLHVAAGRVDGELPFYDLVGTGLSTLDRSVAMESAAERGAEINESAVRVRTLTDICEENAPDDIHFLKIDVEGAELAVVEGLDLARYRPWILVIEATLPNSPQESHADWHGVLQTAGYEFCYFDGLNRYYLASEHADRSERLRVPPNFFDDFVVSGTGFSPLHAQVGQLSALNRELHATAIELRTQNDELVNSVSWRITAPLRIAANEVRQLRHRVSSAPQSLTSPFRRSAQMAMAFVLDRPGLANRVKGWLHRHPDIHRRVLAGAYKVGVLSDPLSGTALSTYEMSTLGSGSLSSLPPRTRMIYRRLKRTTASGGDTR